MTLDEAIYKEEALAYSFGERYKRLGEPVGDLPELEAEHSQYAEWLKELKKLREIPDKLVPKYRVGIQDEYNRGANEMLEEVINDIRKYMEEVNADKGVLDQINEKQNSLKATCKAWDEAIEKDGYVN